MKICRPNTGELARSCMQWRQSKRVAEKVFREIRCPARSYTALNVKREVCNLAVMRSQDVLFL
jgi:hypothetical protein